MDGKTLGLAALVILALYLGWRVNRHSLKREPVYGGLFAVLFNFLSATFFAAILPTVCMTVLVLHPDMVDIAGVSFNPLILAVVAFSALSLISALLFAAVEKAPRERALHEQAQRESQGWTEQDARTSGL